MQKRVISLSNNLQLVVEEGQLKQIEEIEEKHTPGSITLTREYLDETIKKNRPLRDKKRTLKVDDQKVLIIDGKRKRYYELTQGLDEVEKYHRDLRYAPQFEKDTKHVPAWFAERPGMIKGKSWSEQREVELGHEILNYFYFVVHQHSEDGRKSYSHKDVIKEVSNTYHNRKRQIGPCIGNDISFSAEQIRALIKREIGEALLTDYRVEDGQINFGVYAKKHGFQSKTALLAYLGSGHKEELLESIIDLFKKKYVESEGKLKVTDFCRQTGGISTSTFYRYVKESTNKNFSELRAELNRELTEESPVYVERQGRKSSGRLYELVTDVGKKAMKIAAAVVLAAGPLFNSSLSYGEINHERISQQVYVEHAANQNLEQKLAFNEKIALLGK